MPSEQQLRDQISSATRAVEYARRAANLDDSKLEALVDHLHTLAELRVAAGDFSRAESLLREAMFRIDEANSNRRAQPRPILAGNVAASLGYLYDRWGKLDQARDWYTRSLDIAEKNGFQRSDLTASVSNNLGMLDKKAGRIESAERHYRTALALFADIKGDTSSEYAAVANNLGVLLYTEGKHADAQRLHEQALKIRENLLASQPDNAAFSHDLAQTWHNLAAVYKTTGQAAKAAELQEKIGPSKASPTPEKPPTAEATTTHWIIKDLAAAKAKTGVLPAAPIPPVPQSQPKVETAKFNVEVF